jgi:predicted DNA-binding mobile mystery protein A
MSSHVLLISGGLSRNPANTHRLGTLLSEMRHHRAAIRRTLDERLTRIEAAIGVQPDQGWVRAIRDALGMSSYVLAKRMNLSPARVRQFEYAELDGSIRLATLRRVAEALNCRVVYFFLPNEPLEDMVHRQAYEKAATELGVWGRADPLSGDPDLVPRDRADELEDLTLHFVDHRDLWS